MAAGCWAGGLDSILRNASKDAMSPSRRTSATCSRKFWRGTWALRTWRRFSRGSRPTRRGSRARLERRSPEGERNDGEERRPQLVAQPVSLRPREAADLAYHLGRDLRGNLIDPKSS